jgi:hypothetical protein
VQLPPLAKSHRDFRQGIDMTIFYSQTTKGFYPEDMKSDYDAAGYSSLSIRNVISVVMEEIFFDNFFFPSSTMRHQLGGRYIGKRFSR